MNKKAVELSLNTIVIAILVLVVLAVLITIFGTQMQNILKQIVGLGNTTFTESTSNECQSKGNQCALTCPEGSSELNLACPIGQKCCS